MRRLLSILENAWEVVNYFNLDNEQTIEMTSNEMKKKLNEALEQIPDLKGNIKVGISN